MNTEQIEERIKTLENERQNLTTSHDSAMQQFQQLIVNNRNRFQQLTGAIDELKELLKPKGDNNEPIDVGSNPATDRNPDRVSGHLSGDRSYSGVNLGD